MTATRLITDRRSASTATGTSCTTSATSRDSSRRSPVSSPDRRDRREVSPDRPHRFGSVPWRSRPAARRWHCGSVRRAISPPALLDRESKEFTPLVPDDAARVEWLATLVHTAQLLLRAHLPTTDAQNIPIDRPTLLPVLGELPINHEVGSRLAPARPDRPSALRTPRGRPPASGPCSTCWPRRGSSSTFSARTTPPHSSRSRRSNRS